MITNFYTDIDIDLEDLVMDMDDSEIKTLLEIIESEKETRRQTKAVAAVLEQNSKDLSHNEAITQIMKALS